MPGTCSAPRINHRELRSAISDSAQRQFPQQTSGAVHWKVFWRLDSSGLSLTTDSVSHNRGLAILSEDPEPDPLAIDHG